MVMDVNAIGGCCAPAFPFGTALRTRARPPEGRAQTAPRTAPTPPGSLPRSVARHALRSDPDTTARRSRRGAPPQNHECKRGNPTRADSPSRPRGRAGPAPPPWVPSSRAAETSATSTERPRTRARADFHPRNESGYPPRPESFTSLFKSLFKSRGCRWRGAARGRAHDWGPKLRTTPLHAEFATVLLAWV